MFMDLNLTVPNFVYNPLYNSIDLTPERAPEYSSHYDFISYRTLAREFVYFVDLRRDLYRMYSWV